MKTCGSCRFYSPVEVGGSYPENPACRPCRGYSEWQPKPSTAPLMASLGAPMPTPPDSNPKTRFGMTKPPLGLIPGTALVHLAQAFRDGAAKYGPQNWRKDPVSSSTYVNAAFRHLLEWQDGEEQDPVSKVHHLAHAMGCLAILIDAQSMGTLLDDRPPPAPTADLIREFTTPLD